MATPVIQAQPPLTFIPPAFDPLVLRVGRSLMPLYRRWSAQIGQIDVENLETLIESYQQFQEGKTRFLLAFRHPNTNDPLCMAHLLWDAVPQAARQKGIKLNPAKIHAHFIYDRGIPLWAGKWVGWLYSRLGGIPIRRGKVDLMALRSIRHLFANGEFPIAAAPEGATNGHNEIVSPIEPGIAQFGFWCIEDLMKEGRSSLQGTAKQTQQVVIIPIGIQYRFISAPWERINHLLHQLESECGLASTSTIRKIEFQDGVALTAEQESLLYGRLFRLSEHLLTLMETFYRKFYHQPLPTQSVEPSSTTQTTNEHLATRLQTLLNAALTITEQFFALSAKGTFTDRCRRLEQAGWDWIYREDFKAIESLPPVERGLGDRIAEEADLRLWHMRLVESFVSVTGRYVREKPTGDRFAETLLLLWETIARLTHKPAFPRPHLGHQRVHMTVGTPIDISIRWESYQTNRRQAVAMLTHDLQNALEAMIH